MVLVVLLVSGTGLFHPAIYARETANWAAQAVAQDLVNVVVFVPAMALAAWAAARGSRSGFVLWFGLALYAAYSFAIYAFAVHFNALFVAYCAAFGLSLYACLYALVMATRTAWAFTDAMPRRAAGVYLLVVAVLFALLWLEDIVPAALSGSVPKTVAEAGLMTNPVHVIDLSTILPAFALTGVMLLRRDPRAVILAPALLVFGAVMGMSIIVLMLWMAATGVAALEPPPLIIMSGVVAIAATLLRGFLRGLCTQKA